MPDDAAFGEAGTLVLEHRFAIVPKWIIDAQISDCDFRLYAVLLRYGQTSGQRMPGRALLARRLHKASKDTVDRALKELVAIGAVTVERRRDGQRNLTNRYHLQAHDPHERARGRTPAATPADPIVAGGDVTDAPSRRDAATHADQDLVHRSDVESGVDSGGRPGAAGRTDAATPGRTHRAKVAARVRPDPEPLTQREPPPTPPAAATDRPEKDPAALGGTTPHPGRVVGALPSRYCFGPAVVSRRGARALRDRGPRRPCRSLSAATSRAGSVALSVGNGSAPARPARRGQQGLAGRTSRRGAARGRRRLSHPEPLPPGLPRALVGYHPERATLSLDERNELDRLEVRLREADGRRVWLQQRARADLTDAGQPLTRLAVARRACLLLDEAELTPC